MKLQNKNALILFVSFTQNNASCVLANLKGKPLICLSAGSNKIKGVKKLIPLVILNLVKKLYNYSKLLDCTSLYLRIKGINKNKNTFIKYLKVIGFNILFLQERSCLPHGGCKKTKKRRL